MLTYRGDEIRVQLLGLILKGDKWYALGRAGLDPNRRLRLFRLSRVEAITVLDHRFDRPPDFDLAREWAAHRAAFLASIPEYFVHVRISPSVEPLLPTLGEARTTVPLPSDTERDEQGWALLRLRFDHPESALRHLLGLGTGVEVLAPPDLRERLATEIGRMGEVYADSRRGSHEPGPPRLEP
ncbi:WYL domain-containing protein [Ammonicoccus fulvus]|uniref:WYL domain-containing protein n=1 Tax=Ammonicoccus fulvus TaxID=3138240 RepID=A0ABZ3FSL8_9ACTN